MLLVGWNVGYLNLNIYFFLAQSSNPFQFFVVAEEDIETTQAGFSLDVQQTACGQSSFGNQGNDASL